MKRVLRLIWKVIRQFYTGKCEHGVPITRECRACAQDWIL